MSRTVTLAEMRTGVRELVAMETGAGEETGEQFLSNNELDRRINRSLAIWWGKLVRAVPERFAETDDLTADGSGEYPLPDNYFVTLAVEYEPAGGGRRRDLERIPFGERNSFPTTTASVACAYRVGKDTLQLLPPPSSGTYTHVYAPAAPVLSADNDSIDGVNGWEQWILLDVAIGVLAKAADDPSALMAERERVEAEMEVVSQDRDMGNALRVTDTRASRVLRDPADWDF